MRHIKTGSKRQFFKVLASSDSAQAAMMVLRPGQKSGEAVENEHPNAEQWLFVVSGSGTARVGKRRVALHPNSPGYRLILNNVLFPAAKKKHQKT